MQEEFSGPERIVIAGVSVRIGPDVGVEQESLAVLDNAVGVFKIGFAFADGLDFGSAEGHAGLKTVEEKVVVAGSPIHARVAIAGSNGVAGLVLLRVLNVRMGGLPRHGEGPEVNASTADRAQSAGHRTQEKRRSGRNEQDIYFKRRRDLMY